MTGEVKNMSNKSLGEVYVPFFYKWARELREEEFTPEEIATLVFAITDYAETGIVPTLKDRGLRLAFRSWQKDVDVVLEKHRIGSARKKFGAILRLHPEYKPMLDENPKLALVTPAERAAAWQRWSEINPEEAAQILADREQGTDDETGTAQSLTERDVKRIFEEFAKTHSDVPGNAESFLGHMRRKGIAYTSSTEQDIRFEISQWIMANRPSRSEKTGGWR